MSNTRRQSKSVQSAPTSVEDGVRLDVWLWATRFFKTRALAKQAIEAGRVEVNAAAGKPARMIRSGDRLQVTRGEDRYEIEVAALASRRGSAAVAQRCFRETDASRVAREAAAQQRRFAAAGYVKPASKPDKRARRLIRALGDIDAL
jgi:ribosome-associated heat shock protein Hsp15